MLQLHCVRKLPHKPVVEKSLSKYYVGAQREIFAGFFFFFSSIVCNSKLYGTEFSKRESVSSHNAAELSPAKE